MKLLAFFLIFTAALILGGCGGAHPAVSKQHTKAALPAWYLNPPKDTAQYMYGVGSADDRDGAIKAALVDMVSKLGVSIESTMQTHQESFGKYYANSINQSDIKSKVSQIRINNYEVVDAKRISYRQFVVLVKTDKRKFAKGLKKEIDAKLAELEKRYKTALQSDRISRFNTLKQMAKEAKELLPNIYILSQLDGTFDEKSYLQRVQRLRDAFAKEKNALLFSLHITNKNASAFAKRVANYLTGHGLHVGNTKSALQLYIGAGDTVANSAIGKIGIVKVNVKVYDGKTFVGGSDRVYKVRLTGGKESLYRRAAEEFVQDLDKEGFKKVLGINLDL